jgi:four helix bundle protein
MNSKTEELLDRVFLFGVDTLKFLMTLPKEKVYGIVIYQLGKASTSSGSNYEEAQGAESPKDFNHKIGIVLKEIRESNYWFRVLNAVMLNSNFNNELQRLLKESLELKKIFSVIKIKSENNLKMKLKSILKTFSIFHLPFSI